MSFGSFRSRREAICATYRGGEKFAHQVISTTIEGRWIQFLHCKYIGTIPQKMVVSVISDFSFFLDYPLLIDER